MSKSTRGATRFAISAWFGAVFWLGLAGVGIAQPPPEILGTDAAACRPGANETAALVRVAGLKDRKGRLRLQYYPNNPATWLASGAYLRRQEVAVTPAGDMVLCITVPEAGSYAFVVLHDRDEDGRLSIWSDGVGFSNNPKLALAKPKIEKIVYKVGDGVTPIAIVMNYRRGLSVRPIDK